jgi:hypothetical protein
MKDATLKGLRRRSLITNASQPFRVAINQMVVFISRVSKQTLGWNLPTLSALGSLMK